MRGNRVYVLILAALVLASAVTAFVIRASIPHFAFTQDSVADFTMYWGGLDLTKLDELPTSQGLIESAELIAVVTPTGNRELKNDRVLSEFVVSSVLLSNGKASAGDTIYIYESVHVNTYEGNPSVSLGSGTLNLMQTDARYLVLLCFFDQTERYDYTEKDLVTYKLVSESFAAYPWGEYRYLYLPEDGSVAPPAYRDARQYTNIFGDERVRELYEALMAEMLSYAAQREIAGARQAAGEVSDTIRVNAGDVPYSGGRP